jgi:2-dehydro-3-deoxygluconokinase
VIRAVTEARELGVTVSFDCNYRAKLWQAWSAEAPAILRRILEQSDLVFANERDIALILGGLPDNPRDAANGAFTAFPNLKLIAATARVQHSVNHHVLSAAMHTRDGSWQAAPIELSHIVDRIGAGDAFAAALIHALRSDYDSERVIRFALGGACIKHTIHGDFSPVGVADIESLLAADVGVRR